VKGTWALGPSSTFHKFIKNKVEVPTLYSLYNAAFSDAWVDFAFAVQLVSSSVNEPLSLKTISPLALVNGYASTGLMTCIPATQEFFVEDTTTFDGQYFNLVYYSNNSLATQIQVSSNIFQTYDRNFAWDKKNNLLILSVYDPSFFSNWTNFSFAFFTLNVWDSNPSPHMVISFKDQTIFSRYPNWIWVSTTQTILVLQAALNSLSQINFPSGDVSWTYNIGLSGYDIWSDDFAGITIDESSQKLYFLACEKICPYFGGDAAMSLLEFDYSTAGVKMASITALGSFDTVNMIYSTQLNGILVVHTEGWLVFNTLTKDITNVETGGHCADCTIFRE